MTSTRVARAEARDRAWQCPNGCGHGSHQHHEYRSAWTWDLDEEDFVEVPHPRYRPGLFVCDVEGCGCEIDTEEVVR